MLWRLLGLAYFGRNYWKVPKTISNGLFHQFFISTYCCELLFSQMDLIRNNLRRRIMSCNNCFIFFKINLHGISYCFIISKLFARFWDVCKKRLANLGLSKCTGNKKCVLKTSKFIGQWLKLVFLLINCCNLQ